MRMLLSVLAVVILSGNLLLAEDEGSLVTIDIGNAFTFGGFTYDDTTIDIESEMFNPRGNLEFKFGGAPLAFGAEYSKSENTFHGEYSEEDGDAGEGDLDVERNEFAFYLKLIPSYNFNVSIGYRNFEYDITNADIDQYSNGVLDERDRNGNANAKLATGVDAKMNIIIGSPTSINMGIMLGYTYFIDGEYEWEYDEIINGVTTHKTGGLTADAHSLRLSPELSIPLNDNLRIYVNGAVAATVWDAELDDDDPEYAGYDFFMSATAGLRYQFGLQ